MLWNIAPTSLGEPLASKAETSPSPAEGRSDGTISISEALIDWHRMLCAGSVADQMADPPGRTCRLKAQIAPHVGQGVMDLVAFDDEFILMNMRGRFHQPLNYKIAGEGWTRLHFRKSARAKMDFDDALSTELEGPLCQILHQPVGMEDDEWIEGGVDLEWVTVFLRPRLLVERFQLDSISLLDPIRRLAYGQDDLLIQNWSLSPVMTQAMSQIFNQDFRGDLRRIYLEAKAIELICSMSEVMTDSVDERLPVKLTGQDVDRMHEARAILSRNFAAPPSIERLSRQVGVNRNKLSYGFRHLFGQTISEYCAEMRLNQAWQLLRTTDLPIAHVAESVGYSQPAAFSDAFKKRFQQTPRQVRAGS